MEAVISNVKRGYNLCRCTWKGWEHFVAKVLWSVIAYRIRVMTAHLMVKLVQQDYRIIKSSMMKGISMSKNQENEGKSHQK